jgi:thiamine-phosphate pyrophosphorylase
MDPALIAWARAVKRRHRLPPLWFFTDHTRAPAPLAVMVRLPRRLSGVVLRLEGYPAPLALAMAAARLCRARGLALVAADARLAARLGVGVHWRGGRRAGARPRRGLASASAHGAAQLVAARRAGADLAFLSPVFSTHSHPGARTLGARGFAALARRAGPVKPFALGGVSPRRLAVLGPRCAGLGGIELFLKP